MFALIAACGGDNGGFPAGVSGSVAIATVTRPSEGATTAATLIVTETLEPGAPTIEATDAPEATPAPAATDVPTPTQANPTDGGNAALSGFIYPIAGACLPVGDQLMPNAPREYRQGTHEGVDFYGVDNCTNIGLGTPVMAAKAGRVIRIDHGYVDPTAAEMDALLANPANAEALDAFRGRQVWIDHGDGIATRYCHLSAVVAALQVGDAVAQGTIVGYVGECGTPESVTNPGTEYHLHWEVRVGGSFLGAGEAPGQVRSEYLALFDYR